MPCLYEDQELRNDVAHALDKVTRIACEAMKHLEKLDEEEKLSGEAQIWWRDHKKADAARNKATNTAKRFEPLDRELIEEVACIISELVRMRDNCSISTTKKRVIVYLDGSKRPAGLPDSLRDVPISYKVNKAVKPRPV